MSAENSPLVNIDDESILSAIFKDKFSDEERKNPEFLLYLSRLSSFSINSLNMEPLRLKNEKARILDLTQELAFQNYKTFIKTAKCSKDIFKDFGVIENRLQSLLDKLPILLEHGHNFVKETSEINATRSSNSLTLTRHTEVLEILEISQVMDTCVRNQYYEDALELMLYVKRLSKKLFVAEIPLIASIIKDVKQSAQLMLEQLLAQLRTLIQLPACLRVVGYLRRLECFTETELRLRFLQARSSWLDSVLSSIVVNEGENEAYERITRTVEANRVHLFDAVTQYRAIFSDDANTLFNEFHSGKRLEHMPYESAIFHCWLTYRLNLFFDLLRSCLEKGVGNRLDSVLGQCMYFGQSFSKVGADFRCLLIPIFQEAVATSFEKIVLETTREFESEMMSYSLLSTSISSSQISSSTLSPPTSNSDVPQPPSSILNFPPLAVYLNGILYGFNQLRICLPLSLATSLPSILRSSIKSVASIILSFYNAEEPAFSDSEKVSFIRFCNTLFDEVIPHLETCSRFLIHRQTISDMYGAVNMPPYLEKGSVIDVDEVRAILKSCLPKPVEVPDIEAAEVRDLAEKADENSLHSSSDSIEKHKDMETDDISVSQDDVDDQVES